MDSSKPSKPLSANDVDQLMSAIQDLDKSVAYLRRLLQKSVKMQAQAECLQEDTIEPPLLPKVLH